MYKILKRYGITIVLSFQSKITVSDVSKDPRQVSESNLEIKVLSVFQKVGCTNDPDFIDNFALVRIMTKLLLSLNVLRIANNVWKSRKAWETYIWSILIYQGVEKHM